MAGEWLGCLKSWVSKTGGWGNVYQTGASRLNEPPGNFNNLMGGYQNTFNEIKDNREDCCDDGYGYFHEVGDPQYQEPVAEPQKVHPFTHLY